MPKGHLHCAPVRRLTQISESICAHPQSAAIPPDQESQVVSLTRYHLEAARGTRRVCFDTLSLPSHLIGVRGLQIPAAWLCLQAGEAAKSDKKWQNLRNDGVLLGAKSDIMPLSARAIPPDSPHRSTWRFPPSKKTNPPKNPPDPPDPPQESPDAGSPTGLRGFSLWGGLRPQMVASGPSDCGDSSPLQARRFIAGFSGVGRESPARRRLGLEAHRQSGAEAPQSGVALIERHVHGPAP